MAELTTIPPTLRPGVFIEEVKGPPASQPALPNRVLYVGHQLVGTAAPGENILLAGRHLAAGHFGAGAMLTSMIESGWDATAAGDAIEQWAVSVAEVATIPEVIETTASSDVTIAGVATEAVTIVITFARDTFTDYVFTSSVIPDTTTAAAAMVTIQAELSAGLGLETDYPLLAAGVGPVVVSSDTAGAAGNLGITATLTSAPAGLVVTILPPTISGGLDAAAEIPGATAATGTITVGGVATEAGSVKVVIGSSVFAVPIVIGDDGTTVATTIDGIIDDAHPLPVEQARSVAAPATVASVGAVATVTARHSGSEGNHILVRVDGDHPPGMTFTVVAMAGGLLNPVLGPADIPGTLLASIAALNPQRIVLGFSDSDAIAAMIAELTARDQANREQFARVFVGSNGSVDDAIAMADVNSKYVTLATYNLAASPPWEIAAWMGMIDAFFTDPSASRIGAVGLPGVLSGPLLHQRIGDAAQELLLGAGATPILMDDFYDPVVLRHITTYNTDPATSLPDLSKLDASLVTTAWALRYTADAFLTSRWKGAKIGKSGGEPPPAGVKVSTPERLKASILVGVWDAIWAVNYWVDPTGREEFTKAIAAQISATDLTRIDGYLEVLPIRVLAVIAMRFAVS